MAWRIITLDWKTMILAWITRLAWIRAYAIICPISIIISGLNVFGRGLIAYIFRPGLTLAWKILLAWTSGNQGNNMSDLLFKNRRHCLINNSTKRWNDFDCHRGRLQQGVECRRIGAAKPSLYFRHLVIICPRAYIWVTKFYDISS